MRIDYIEELNNTGIVKAFAVPKDQARWRIYLHNIKADMEDLKYYEELGKIVGTDPSHMVRVPQGHSINIRVVDKDAVGEGVIKEEVPGFVDGAITNQKGVLLLSVEADCTPVYIVDKKNKAIGLIHSGWRGTVGQITEKAIGMMKENYGTKTHDLIIYFGPSICGKCYEVGEDLIPEFKKILDDAEIGKVFSIIEGKIESNEKGIKQQKYHVDVTEALRLSLLKYGIKDSQMIRSKYCTHHSGIYDSWRLSKDRTKQMLTGMMLI